MVSYGAVRRWQPGPLDDTERQLKRKSESLLRLNDDFTEMATPREWTGDAATSARDAHRRLTDGMEQLVALVSAARSAIGDTADALIGLGHAVEEAEGLARAHGFGIGDDGAVNDVVAPQAVPDDQVDDVRRERQRVHAELVDRVEQILRRAADIDNDLADVLTKISDGRIGEGGATTLAAAAAAGARQSGLSVLEPPRGGSPADNAGWWDTLSSTEKKAIIAEHPDWIGNRDGIPFTARDAANRTRLEIEKARLQAEARQLQADLDDNLFGGLFSNADARLEQVEEKLASIEAIESTLAKTGERQLLVFNTGSERADAAIANGNVDIADHVAVFTPGFTSNVPDSLDEYDTEMNHLLLRSGDELRRYGDGGSVATVTWIGYQAPQATAGSFLSDNSVLASGAAEAGAAKLTPFLQGIDAARDTDAHLTALGHSYGSTTTGLALQNNTGVDEAVFFGSPGIGTSHIDDLNVPDGHATYIEAKNDAIGDATWFGMDPTHMDGMNHASSAEARHPGDGRILGEVIGHTSYLDDGSTSQYNTAVITGGMSERVLEGDNRGFGDIGSWSIPGTY